MGTGSTHLFGPRDCWRVTGLVKAEGKALLLRHPLADSRVQGMSLFVMKGLVQSHKESPILQNEMKESWMLWRAEGTELEHSRLDHSEGAGQWGHMHSRLQADGQSGAGESPRDSWRPRERQESCVKRGWKELGWASSLNP